METLVRPVGRPPEQRIGRVTKTQREILQMVADGMTTADIAKERWNAEGTIKAHIQRAMETLEVGTRCAAVVIGIREGWLQ